MSRQRWASPSCSAASMAAPAARPALTAASAAGPTTITLASASCSEMSHSCLVMSSDTTGVRLHAGRGRVHQVEPGRHPLGRTSSAVAGSASANRPGSRPRSLTVPDPAGPAPATRAADGNGPPGRAGGRHRECGGLRAVGPAGAAARRRAIPALREWLRPIRRPPARGARRPGRPRPVLRAPRRTPTGRWAWPARHRPAPRRRRRCGRPRATPRWRRPRCRGKGLGRRRPELLGRGRELAVDAPAPPSGSGISRPATPISAATARQSLGS